jgi:hypothetical protein
LQERQRRDIPQTPVASDDLFRAVPAALTVLGGGIKRNFTLKIC